jgi:hypothetical protein
MDFKWKHIDGRIIDEIDHYTVCADTDLCDCNMIAEIKLDILKGHTYECPRFDRDIRLTKEELIIKCMSYLTSSYEILEGDLMRVVRDPEQVLTELKISMMHLRNCTPVPKFMNSAIYPSEEVLPRVPDRILFLYKTWDVKYFSTHYKINKPFCWYEKNVWKKYRYYEKGVWYETSGLSWDDTDNPSLQGKLLSSLSWFNRCFTGCDKGQYAQLSHTEVQGKVIKQIKKFDNPTKDLNDAAKSIKHLQASALNDMYDYMGVKKYFGTQKFVYDSEMFDKDNLISEASAGRLPGPPDVVITGDPVRVISTNGKKVEQHSLVAGYARYACGMIYNGIKKVIDYAYDSGYVAVKRDVTVPTSPTDKGRKAQMDDNWKVRGFFILNYFTVMMGSIWGEFRQVIERGNMIRIGQVWWHGGAQRFAEDLKAFSKEFVWFDGDFTGLDKSINRYLLCLYISQAGVYYDWKNIPLSSARVLKAILQYLLDSISIKVVNLYGNLWFIMYGVMPSGIFETSHGDSWIICYLFFLYVRETCVRYPLMAAAIRKGLRSGFIIFVAYGDDHVMGVHRSLSDYINEEGYAAFCAKYFDMKIRDARRIEVFSSTLDPTGELKREGVVFLQRYFIENNGKYDDLPNILPVRPASKIITKFAYGSTGSRTNLSDYKLATIGQAYDSGVNPVAYQFCEHMWNGIDVSPADLAEKIKSPDTNEELNRLFHRVGLTKTELESGFPDWGTCLRMHKRDDNRNDFSMKKVEGKF